MASWCFCSGPSVAVAGLCPGGCRRGQPGLFAAWGPVPGHCWVLRPRGSSLCCGLCAPVISATVRAGLALGGTV